MPELDPSASRSLSQDARRIFTQAVSACSIEQAFAAKVSGTLDPWNLTLQNQGHLDLRAINRILILAIGKAASAMLTVFLRVYVPPRCQLEGILIAPSLPQGLPPEIRHFAGGHPVPNRASFEAAAAALAMLRHAAEQDDRKTFCFFLVSGGASAMMDLPFDPAITLEDTVAYHRALVLSGASIAEMNCVRKHFSAVKGGRLALAAGPLPRLTFLVSDVPAGKLDAISSGPTLPDSTTMEQCRRTIETYRLEAVFPAAVRDFFTSALFVETPKPGDFAEDAYVLLSSDDLAKAACKSAEKLGYTVVIDHTCDDWDYRLAADYLLDRIRALRRIHPRICLISAGEIAVEVNANTAGIGGRNLHFTLHCATRLIEEERIAVLSAGSDGVDGNSIAAGAVVEASTVAEHRHQAEQALQNFASFDLLAQLGATIVTGPTGNNLRDLRILLAD